MGTSSALGNLPPQLTVFIGREAELAGLRRTLLSARLVTLTGAGGTGKTRLAIEAAATVAAFGDGVWWVDLSQVNAERLVPTVTAAALPFVEAPYRDATATLVDHLRTRRALLLLDNCEHVLEEVAALVDGLLRACPGLTILATSRQPLDVDGEVVWRVPSLSFPVFVGDNRTFCLCIMAPPWDRSFRSLRHPDAFMRAAKLLPGVGDWIDQDTALPVTPVLPMGQVSNAIRHYTTAAGPVAPGLQPIGDALCHTNPTFAFGASLSLQHAFTLADLLPVAADRIDLARRFDEAVGEDLERRYQAVADEDRDRARLWAGEPIDVTDPATSLPLFLRAVVYKVAPADPRLLRAVVRRIDLLDPPIGWSRTASSMSWPLRSSVRWASETRSHHLVPPASRCCRRSPPDRRPPGGGDVLPLGTVLSFGMAQRSRKVPDARVILGTTRRQDRPARADRR